MPINRTNEFYLFSGFFGVLFLGQYFYVYFFQRSQRPAIRMGYVVSNGNRCFYVFSELWEKYSHSRRLVLG
ncbi:hypothetical protein OSCI_3720053 [Kamptonema sp. PCC 6506]|nr:hypothetical protein OSCI_3720053 [Kamptonema sp. PCC 6506]